MATANIAKRWRDLSGQNHWNGLLKPLDKDLQTYMLHYGDMVEATYLTFIKDTASRFAGGSAYPSNTLLNLTGMIHKSAPLMKYTVTKYIYGLSKFDLPFMVTSVVENPWTKQSNWMGFVAVATDEGKAVLGRRDIVVAWRGTLQPIEWAKDFDGHFTPGTSTLKDPSALMHAGFYSIYTDSDARSSYNKTSARDQALAEVNRLINQYKAEDISLTTCGHSLGGAICVINAADLALNAVPAAKPYPVTSFPFAGPRAGNFGWKNVCDRLGAATNSVLSAGKGNLRVLRIVNRPDIVPQSPPTSFGFAHVGQEFLLDASFSSIIQNPFNIGISHDMESSYQHGISISTGSLLLDEPSDVSEQDTKASSQDGISTCMESEAVDGRWKGDESSVRDIALMNRHQDAVKPRYCIAPSWWTAENKGMVQLSNGKWQNQAGMWILNSKKADYEDGEGASNNNNNQGISN